MKKKINKKIFVLTKKARFQGNLKNFFNKNFNREK